MTKNQPANQAFYFGLINESQFDRSELYGFEVDMTGRVVTPEFHPSTQCSEH